jgi:hypothetical protein
MCPHAKGWHSVHHTILAPLSRHRQAHLARALALALLPLLLGLGYSHEGLADPSPPVARVAVLRRVRQYTWRSRPVRAARVWPIARQLLPPVLAQAGLLALRTELGLGSGQELERPLPWGYHLQHILCGDW